MIVVFIIGIITSFAVYSIAPIGPAREAKREAQSLMATLDYAQQRAIISHQPYGLVVSNSGYQFFVLGFHNLFRFYRFHITANVVVH